MCVVYGATLRLAAYVCGKWCHAKTSGILHMVSHCDCCFYGSHSPLGRHWVYCYTVHQGSLSGNNIPVLLFYLHELCSEVCLSVVGQIAVKGQYQSCHVQSQ